VIGCAQPAISLILFPVKKLIGEYNGNFCRSTKLLRKRNLGHFWRGLCKNLGSLGVTSVINKGHSERKDISKSLMKSFARQVRQKL